MITLLSYYFLGAYLVMLLFSIMMQFESFYEYCVAVVSTIKSPENTDPNKTIWKIMFGLSVLSAIGLLVMIFLIADYLIWHFKK